MYETRDELAKFISEYMEAIEESMQLEHVETLAKLVSAAADLNNSLK